MNKNLTPPEIERIRNNLKKYNLKKTDKTMTCNICGYETEYELLPFNTRKNELCLRCQSLRRARLLYYVLEHYTDILEREDVKILQTAPSPVLYKRFKKQYKDNYISSDIRDLPHIDEIIDIQDITYPDNTFDLVLSAHVLEHIPDYPKALREIYRVLKPGGLLILLIPTKESPKTFEYPQINTPKLRERYYGQNDHLRFFSVDNVFKDLKDTGFNTVKGIEKKYKKEHPEDFEKHRLGNDPVFIAEKPEKPHANIKNKEIRKFTLQQEEKYCSLCDAEDMLQSPNNEGDIICFNCKSHSDERLIYNELYFDINDDSVILDFNPSGALKSKLMKDSKNYNQNIPEKSVLEKLILKDTKDKYLNQLQKIRDNCVDFIISNHFLDQQKHDYQIIEEFYRILKPNGKLIAKESVDMDLDYKLEVDEYKSEDLKEFFYGNPEAIRIYGRDFPNLCRFAGFKVEYDDPENQVNNLQTKQNKKTKSPLFICTKD